MPRASCRSSVMAALVDVWASATQRLAPPPGRRRSSAARGRGSCRPRPAAAARRRGGRARCGCARPRRRGRLRRAARLEVRACFGELRLAGRHDDRAAPARRAAVRARPRRRARRARRGRPRRTAQASGTSMSGAGERDRRRCARRAERRRARRPRRRSTPARKTTIQPRMVAIAALATARQLDGSMTCSQSVRR